MRDYLDTAGFVDVETPMLTRATPEGARDYIVPSRTHPGKFFALPQSPQLFKQLLMMSGLDRYYQIVRCFRDEDLRADRQPEFTQLDIEMSFVNEEIVTGEMESLIRHVFKAVLDVDLPDPFPRMAYAEAMQRFGSDKPDLRIDLELVEVSDLLGDVEFKVFAGPASDPEGRVAALCLPGGAALSRKELDDYAEFVGRYGARGLAYIKVNDAGAGREGLQSPILKFLPDDAVTAILQRTGAASGDVIFFGADKARIVNEALGALRVKLGEDRGLVKDEWAPLWVVDFPMFEKDPQSKRWMALHHPFTAPRPQDVDFLASTQARNNPTEYLKVKRAQWAGDVHGDPANERCVVTQLRRRNAKLLQFGKDQMINERLFGWRGRHRQAAQDRRQEHPSKHKEDSCQEGCHEEGDGQEDDKEGARQEDGGQEDGGQEDAGREDAGQEGAGQEGAG